MKKIILLLILCMGIGVMSSCKHMSHETYDMYELFEIKSITLVDSYVVRKDNLSFIPPKLETRYRYEVKLSSKSTEQDTSIIITRNQKHEINQYIGETVQILNNELCYPREIP